MINILATCGHKCSFSTIIRDYDKIAPRHINSEQRSVRFKKHMSLQKACFAIAVLKISLGYPNSQSSYHTREVLQKERNIKDILAFSKSERKIGSLKAGFRVGVVYLTAHCILH